MGLLKAILMTLVLSSLIVVPLSCASESGSVAGLDNQTITVQRGDLQVNITSSGNLTLSLKEDLAFDISGTVEEILVEAGDSVEKGQLLAKLDTSQWENELRALERSLLQAEINLENAEVALEKAKDGTNTAVTGDIVLRNADQRDIDIKEMQVELAQARLDDARQSLEESRDASPEIVAPFDGFITRVNVDGGDEVKKGTVAVVIADPTKFEADILVSEMDILQVKVGGKAMVQVDAMQGLSLPAEVTHIAPTANIQSGVVNYRVKVEIKSLQAIQQKQQKTRQGVIQDILSGKLPERLQQAIDEGRITREQVLERIRQRQQGQGGLPGGPPGGQQRQQPGLRPAIPQDFQLREGLTVTVSILVDERNNVLLVPNRAITRQGQETIVQVLKDGVAEPRSITTGISDFQYTEVTDGLSEGEQVVIPKATTTTTTKPNQRGARLPFLPGGRRPPR